MSCRIPVIGAPQRNLSLASDVSSKTSPFSLLSQTSADKATVARPAPKPAAAAPAPSKSNFSDELAKADKPMPTKAPAKAAAPELEAKPAPVARKAAEPTEAKDAAAPKDAAKNTAKADDAGKVDDKKDAAKSSRKDLAPLKQAAASNRQAVDSAPAVAFLSGHLEKIQPAEIPGLLTDTPFLTDAVGETDLQSFLSQPTTIGDMIDSLGLPEEVVEEAERLGLDLTATVTPSDFLKSIGLDPQRVAAELKVLQDNLSGGSIATYMQRAQALAGRNPVKDIPAQTEGTKDARPPFVPAAPTGVPSGLPPLNPLAQTGGVSPTVAPATAGKVSSAPQGLARGDLQSFDTMALLEALTASPEDQLARAAEAAQALGVSGQGQGLSGLDLTSLSADTIDQKLLSTDVALPTLDDATAATTQSSPSMNGATFDAWAAFGDRLRGTDTKMATADAAESTDAPVTPALGRSLEEQLFSRQVGAPTPAQSNAGLGTLGMNAQAQQLNMSSLKPGVERFDPRMLAEVTARPEARSERLDFAPAVGAPSQTMLAHFAGLNKDGAASTLAPANGNAVSIDELRLALPTIAERGSDAGQGEGRGFGGNGEGAREFNLEQGSDRLLGLTQLDASSRPSLAKESTFSGALATQAAADPTVMTPEQRVQMVQQVIDRATVLMRDGGGSVRLDLGSPELGNLEMAINMQDDRMDVRILTGSDRVRDAMMADLVRLKDALAVQNVQLGNVEVGVNGRNASGFAGFAGNNGGYQQQRQDREAFPAPRSTSIPGLDRLSNITRPVMPHVASSSLMNQNGRIAIRA